MLTHLSIRNIVLIEACDLAFQPGLCVLTGETGAGKSILLDSLGLVLGERGEAGLVRQGEAQGSVTAEFDITRNAAAQKVLRELGLEGGDSLIIRRGIAADGKGRALANDQPVSVAALKRLGETLVETHGQHDSRGLMDVSTHRPLLDAYGKCDAAAGRVKKHYQAWQEAQAALERLAQEVSQARREEDYLRHMAGELQKLNPQAGEEEALAAQRARMMQSEKLFETLNEALQELRAGKGAAAVLRAAQRLLARSALNADGRFGAAIEALDSAAEAADQAIDVLEGIGSEAAYNPAKLEAVEERLFALKAAARKYGLSPDELLGLRDEAEAKLSRLSSRGEEEKRLERAEREARAEYAAAAEELSRQRARAAKRLTQAVEAELAPLRMGGARFHVRIEPLPEQSWGGQGVEAVTFEAATNVGAKGGAAFAPLAKIASGGELSRFMLAIKAAMREVRSTPTLIFDEIDAGTGGAVADAIGARLAALAQVSQILVVTHLPQVAARGSQHLQVRKALAKGQVRTEVEALANGAREEELARMLAGSRVTSEARRAALKLLEEAV